MQRAPTRTRPTNSRIDAHNHRVTKPTIPVRRFTTEEQADFESRTIETLNTELSAFSPKHKHYIASIFLTGTKSLYGNWKGVVEIDLVKKWANSLAITGLNGIIFHNCFTKEQLVSFAEYPVEFVYTTIPPNYMSGLWRFAIYNALIEKFGGSIDGMFFTDSTDLDVLKNPFTQPEYRTDKIYIGHEIGNNVSGGAIAGNRWMLHAAVGFPEYVSMVNSNVEFANRPLLNAGLVGGNIEAIKPFIRRMKEMCNAFYPIAETQDMPVINYLAEEFKDKVFYGDIVNTIFNSYEQNNTIAWFRHK